MYPEYALTINTIQQCVVIVKVAKGNGVLL